jgi:hypothetical protein
MVFLVAAPDCRLPRLHVELVVSVTFVASVVAAVVVVSVIRLPEIILQAETKEIFVNTVTCCKVFSVNRT